MGGYWARLRDRGPRKYFQTENATSRAAAAGAAAVRSGIFSADGKLSARLSSIKYDLGFSIRGGMVMSMLEECVCICFWNILRCSCGFGNLVEIMIARECRMISR